MSIPASPVRPSPEGDTRSCGGPPTDRLDTRSTEAQTMKTIPYLNFDGDCRDAFHFYAELLGGEVQGMISHGESPIAGEVPAEWHDRILNSYLVAGDIELMGSDVPPGADHRPGGIHLSLHVDSASEADRIWAALKDGGMETMPFGPTFWAERFGMLVDRFGTPWMINYEGSVSYRPDAPATAGGEG
jgi:PhnB protein